MRILILGGAGLTGPHQVRYALSCAHDVTVFNRGGLLPPELAGVEQLQGDRDAGGLRALQGRDWRLGIDNPTIPASPRRSAVVRPAGP